MIRIWHAAVAMAGLTLTAQSPLLGQGCSGFWNDELVSRTSPAIGETLLIVDDGHGPALFIGGAWKWDFNKWVRNTNRIGQQPFVMEDPEGPVIYGWEETGVEHGLFKWDGTQMVPVATLPDRSGGCQTYEVRSPFQALDIGGKRTWFGRAYYDECHGQIYKHDLFKWDGATWERTMSTLWEIAAMTVFNGELYFAGTPDMYCWGDTGVFKRHADGTIELIAELSTGGCGGQVKDMLVFDEGSGPALFLAGYFTSLNGQPIGHIAKWDGAQWISVGEGFEGTIGDLEIWKHDGVEELVAVGSFLQTGGLPAKYIAVWNGNEWRSFESGADKYVRKAVNVDLPWRKSIFFAGWFDSIGGIWSPRLAEWVCYDCRANCDDSTGQGVLDIFDFLCFQNSFVNAEPYACGCDTSTGPDVCDIFDFICFQDAFVGGCP